MHKQLLFIILITACTASSAQIKALTESGREVFLYQDGTWKYANDSTNSSGSDSIKLNSRIYTRSKASTFLIKSQVFNVGIYINPAKWKIEPKKEGNTEIEYTFYYKQGDAYGVIIPEKSSIDLPTLKQVALINAQKVSPDVRIVNSEYRMVNGIKLLCMELRGTIKGLKFVYFGYYYNNDHGTMQLLTYTTAQLFDSYKAQFEEFLNGFVVIDN